MISGMNKYIINVKFVVEYRNGETETKEEEYHLSSYHIFDAYELKKIVKGILSVIYNIKEIKLIKYVVLSEEVIGEGDISE